MALGESEVLGQVRGALALAREAGATRAVSHRMFESALAAGKRVRAETDISRHPLSVASIGYELATRVFGRMSEHTVLVLGAGETGTLFAKLAREAGIADVRVSNRTAERAETLAASFGGRAVPWSAALGIPGGGRPRRRHDLEPDAGGPGGGRRRRRCASGAGGR